MPSIARDFQHCLLHIDIFDCSVRNRRSESCSSEPDRPRSAWISSVEPVQALLHRTASDEVEGERTPLRRRTRIKQHSFHIPSKPPMTTADDPDVFDVEFRGLPSTPRRPCIASRARAQPAAERRIGLQHLAFFRGYLEGLDLAELADQYLEFGRDAQGGPPRAPGWSPPSSPRRGSVRTSQPRACSRSGRPRSPRRRPPGMPARTPTPARPSAGSSATPVCAPGRWRRSRHSRAWWSKIRAPSTTGSAGSIPPSRSVWPTSGLPRSAS